MDMVYCFPRLSQRFYTGVGGFTILVLVVYMTFLHAVARFLAHVEACLHPEPCARHNWSCVFFVVLSSTDGMPQVHSMPAPSPRSCLSFIQLMPLSTCVAAARNDAFVCKYVLMISMSSMQPYSS